mgnify:CR=1 FL=1
MKTSSSPAKKEQLYNYRSSQSPPKKKKTVQGLGARRTSLTEQQYKKSRGKREDSESPQRLEPSTFFQLIFHITTIQQLE